MTPSKFRYFLLSMITMAIIFCTMNLKMLRVYNKSSDGSIKDASSELKDANQNATKKNQQRRVVKESGSNEGKLNATELESNVVTRVGKGHTSSLFWRYFSPSSKSQGLCMPVSLVLFGVPKQFSRVWTHYLEHIVRPNPHIQFDIHLHMYSDLSNFTNQKNNEINVITESPSDIQNILMSQMERVNRWNRDSLNMTLITSSQTEYDKSLSWLEPRDVEQFEMLSLETIKNIFRQGHSMQQSHLSAFTQSLLHNVTTDRNFFFLRSDTLLVAPIKIPCSMQRNELHIPSWQTNGNPQYNDRAALAGFVAAKIYAKAKSAPFRKYIIAARNEEELNSLNFPRNKKSRHVKILHNSPTTHSPAHAATA
eukprot:scaffold77041_cov51-Cyclotella_meneghiniana.AAC.4